MLNKFIEHSRNRSYMSGIERNKLRVKETGEVFTPTQLVQEMLDRLEEENVEEIYDFSEEEPIDLDSNKHINIFE